VTGIKPQLLPFAGLLSDGVISTNGRFARQKHPSFQGCQQ
jgi:hypothetical protein